jgi:hypothetical protein
VSEVTLITGCPRVAREADLVLEMKSEVADNFRQFLAHAKSELVPILINSF